MRTYLHEFLFLCAFTLFGGTVSNLFADDANPTVTEKLRQRGKVIYTEKCADCHGKRGEGVKDAYERPLIGDSSIGELTDVIERTMPEGEAELCKGEDAAAVAAFVHYDFYSEAAQVRNSPPRVRLSRLTGSQLRNSIADIYGSFQSPMWVTDKRGVKGQYFDGSRWRNEKKKIDRVDETLNFDFKEESPGEGINPKDFYIHWSAGLIIEETGRYEIIVRSTCAFDFHLGTAQREFIDNRVQSGDKTEFRRSIMLTAGRVYPFTFEFIQKKRKTKQPPATVSLSWIPPNGTEAVIPTRNLTPDSPPSTYSLQTILPPDDRSYGYDRGINVSQEWDESTTKAALEFADIVIEELWPTYQRKNRNNKKSERELLAIFLEELLEVAFRGPLDDETRRTYVTLPLASETDNAEAIRRSVLMSLKSPRFLYPLLDGHRSPSQRVANRLSLTLHDSLPNDVWLLQLIEKDHFDRPERIQQAAHRMVNDYRTQAKVREMLHSWLHLDSYEEATKDKTKFPEWNEQVVTELRVSLNELLDEIVWSDRSDYRQLFISESSVTTPTLANLFGEDWKAGEALPGGFSRTRPNPDRHFGVLSHPAVMSRLATHDSSSPIHRGVFIYRFLLGRSLRPPEAAITPFSPDLHPDLTTRERVAKQTSPDNCRGCHIKINGLGFAMENFDAIGRYREQENNKPIDASGRYISRSGEVNELHGVKELAHYLANSEDAHRAFVNRMFLHLVKQPPAAFGLETLDQLTESFRKNNYNIRELIVQIAVIAASHETLAPAIKDQT